jgi:hypothetical protein
MTETVKSENEDLPSLQIIRTGTEFIFTRRPSIFSDDGDTVSTHGKYLREWNLDDAYKGLPLFSSSLEPIDLNRFRATNNLPDSSITWESDVSSFNIDKEGHVTKVYANGITREVYQIPLSNWNPHALDYLIGKKDSEENVAKTPWDGALLEPIKQDPQDVVLYGKLTSYLAAFYAFQIEFETRKTGSAITFKAPSYPLPEVLSETQRDFLVKWAAQETVATEGIAQMPGKCTIANWPEESIACNMVDTLPMSSGDCVKFISNDPAAEINETQAIDPTLGMCLRLLSAYEPTE